MFKGVTSNQCYEINVVEYRVQNTAYRKVQKREILK